MDPVRISDSFLFQENKKKGNYILPFTAKKKYFIVDASVKLWN